MNDDELMHYGKVGMKWGKRHASSGSSTKTSSAKKLIEKLGTKKLKATNEKLKASNKKLKDANKKASEKAKQDPHDVTTKTRMSDNEMKSRINRLEMEKKYASLTQKQSSQAKKMVVDILSTAFKTTAQAYVTKMMGQTLANITADKVAAATGASKESVKDAINATVNASTAENHSSSKTSFSGKVYPGSANKSSSSNNHGNNYVYPNFKLLG